MAQNAQSSVIIKPTFPTAKGYRMNVVCVPITSGSPGSQCTPQFTFEFFTSKLELGSAPSCVDFLGQLLFQDNGVGAAEGTDSPISLEQTFSNVGRLRADFVFVDTSVATKGSAGRRYFGFANPTEGSAGWTFWKVLGFDPAR